MDRAVLTELHMWCIRMVIFLFYSRKFNMVYQSCSGKTTAKVDNYAVSRKLLIRLFSFFHNRCTLSHWVSVRKYTGKKHNIFEKNAFLCHVWQTCDTYRNNWSQTCVLQEVYGQTQWTAPAFVQEVCANDAHYATEWAWEKVPGKNSTFFVSRKNLHFFVWNCCELHTHDGEIMLFLENC